jgi:excisionase family DNA binding protein
MANPDKLLTASQAAEMLGLRTKTMYALAAERRIPSIKLLGTVLRFRESDLRRIIEESTTPVLEQ